MAGRSLDRVVRHIRGLAHQTPGPEWSDAQLLDRYAAQRDEAAFAALVQRHGRLVRAVCQHVLHQEEDIEDAVQATFIVLARKAASIRKRVSLASWLHGVAFRIALNARKATLRRRAFEKRGTNRAPEQPAAEAALHELQALLDKEVQRLPEKFRAPFVLCCLEGLSKGEAARELGWKEGTVSGRVAQARERLRQRLAMRGVTLSAALCATAISHPNSRAALSATAMDNLLAFTAGRTSNVPIGARTMAEGAISGFNLLNARLAAVLVICLAAGGVGLTLAHRGIETHKGTPATATGLADAATPLQDKQARVDRNGDPLPPGAVTRLGSMHFRHDGEADSLVFSPNGKMLAALTQGGIVLWDAQTGKEALRLQTAGFERIAIDRMIDFSPDSKFLVGPSDSGHVGVLEITTGKNRRTFPIPEAQESPLDGSGLQTLRFSPDGAFLALAGNNYVCIFDLATGKVSHQFKENIGAIAFSPDGKSLVMQVIHWSPRTNVVQARSLQTGQILWQEPVPPGRGGVHPGAEELICAIAFSPSGRIMATAGADRILLWDAVAGKYRSRIEAKMGQVKNLAFTPDGTRLVSGSGEDGRVHVWDAGTGKEQRHMDARLGLLRSMALSADGRTVAAGGVHNVIRLWDLDTGHELFGQSQGHDARVNSIAYSPDGKLLASGGENGQIWIWDRATGRPMRSFRGTSASSIAFSPDGRCLAVLSPGKHFLSKIISLCDASNGRELRRIAPGDAYEVRAMAFTPDGKTIISADWMHPERKVAQVICNLNVWETGTGQRLNRLSMKGLRPECLAISPDGAVAAVAGCSDQESFRIWDLGGGREILAFRAGQIVSAIAFSPDGRTLVSGGADGRNNADNKVRLWEVATGKEVFAMKGNPRTVTAVAFSPDGRIIASSESAAVHDGDALRLHTIRLWEATTGARMRHLEGFNSTVTSLAFAPDDSQLATGLEDGTLLLWEVSLAMPARPLRGSRLGPKDLEGLWSDLAGEDACKAYAAIWTLTAASEKTLPLMKERLKPAQPIDDRRIQRLVRDLDSERYSTRQDAQKELQLLLDEEVVRKSLRRALAAKPSLEVAQRLEQLLSGPSGLGPGEVLRGVRAVEILERIAIPEARQLLQALAGGAPEVRLTREAKGALARLAKCSPGPR